MEHYLGIQTVSDKAVADCVEALIGVYLRVSIKKDFFNIIIFFNINNFLLKEYGYQRYSNIIKMVSNFTK